MTLPKRSARGARGVSRQFADALKAQLLERGHDFAGRRSAETGSKASASASLSSSNRKIGLAT